MNSAILDLVKIRNRWLFYVSLLLLSFCGIQSSQAIEKVTFVQGLTSGLKSPVSVASNDEGDVYVLDHQLAKVFVFNSEGALKFTFGSKGTQLGLLKNPHDIALAPNGNVIVADTGNSRLQVFDSQGHVLYQLGQAGSLPGQFKEPTNVAVNLSGNIFVTDAVKRTITKFSPKGVYLNQEQLDSKPYDLVFDSQQALYILMPEISKVMKYQDGNLISKQQVLFRASVTPAVLNSVAMSVDANGDVYLLENKFFSIQKLEAKTKNSLLSFGSKGKGRGQFESPSGINVNKSARIYVADTKNHRVQVLDVIGSTKTALKAVQSKNQVIDFDSAIPAEKTIVDLSMTKNKDLYILSDYYGHIMRRKNTAKRFKYVSQEKGHLNFPQAMYIKDEGSLLVSDTGNNRIHFINSDGTFQYQFGKRGSKSSQFNSLHGIAVNQKGYIYAADTKNKRIQIFSADGIYLKEFGLEDSEGNINSAISDFAPQTLKFNSKGRLYVLDNKNKTITIFTEEGKLINSINQKTTAKAKLINPVDMSIDENDYIYVADRGDHSVKIYNPKGNYYFSFGSSGRGPSYFPKISAVDAFDGKIYVADYKVDKVKVFAFNSKQNSAMENKPAKVVKNKKSIKKLVKKLSSISIIKKVNALFDKVKFTYKAKIVKEKLIVTATTSPIKEQELLKAKEGYEIARKKFVRLTAEMIMNKTQYSKEYVDSAINVESDQLFNDGVFEIVVSIPKDHI